MDAEELQNRILNSVPVETWQEAARDTCYLLVQGYWPTERVARYLHRQYGWEPRFCGTYVEAFIDSDVHRSSVGIFGRLLGRTKREYIAKRKYRVWQTTADSNANPGSKIYLVSPATARGTVEGREAWLSWEGKDGETLRPGSPGEINLLTPAQPTWTTRLHGFRALVYLVMEVDRE